MGGVRSTYGSCTRSVSTIEYTVGLVCNLPGYTDMLTFMHSFREHLDFWGGKSHEHSQFLLFLATYRSVYTLGGFPGAIGAEWSPAGSCVASHVYHNKWSEFEIEL